MANLALFDFDGTVTTSDTFTPFIRSAVESKRMLVGRIVLAPLIVAYRWGLIPASSLRSWIVRIGFCGSRESDVRQIALKYSRDKLPEVVRPKALERIKWHKERGDRIAIVSASLDLYLSDWCRQLGVDHICTKVEVRNGFLTGRYFQGDCTGAEKARRILQTYTLGEYKLIYAYGDTKDDEKMLELANKKYFRWREVDDVSSAIAAYENRNSDLSCRKRFANIEMENACLERLVAEEG